MKNTIIIKFCLILLAYITSIGFADISITEIYRFDGDGEALYGVSDLVPLDEGNFVVSDRRMKRVLKVNSEGELVRTAGRDGRGPGEFNGGANLIVEQSGLLYVFDLSSSKIAQVFDHDLNYVTTISVELPVDAVALNDSLMMLHYHDYVNDKYLQVHKYNGERVTSVKHDAGSKEFTRLNDAHLQNIGDGTTVVVYRHLNRIEYYKLDFSLRNRISIASLPDQSPVYKMPGSDQIAARFTGTQRSIVERASYRPEYRIFEAIAVDGKGNLFVQINSELWDSDDNIIVIDENGDRTGSFNLPGNQLLLAIGSDDRLYSKTVAGEAVYVYQINR